MFVGETFLGKTSSFLICGQITSLEKMFIGNNAPEIIKSTRYNLNTMPICDPKHSL